MTDFDSLNPEVTPTILDIAYADAEELVESYLDLWRTMHQSGTPSEFLEAEGKTAEFDKGFLSGGVVAIEVLLSEIAAKRDSIFLEG